MGLCSVDLQGNGVAAGQIFAAKIERHAKDPFVIEVREGTPLFPTDRGIQTMITDRALIAPLVEMITTVILHGYCLAPTLLPPPKTKPAGWKITNPDTYPRLAIPARTIIDTAKRLSGEGKFHSDMTPEKYLRTVTQRALWYWADPDEFGLPRLIEDLAQQVKESGGKQTKEDIEELAANLWADINLTLKRSGVKPGTKPEDLPDSPGISRNPSDTLGDLPHDPPDDDFLFW